MVAVRKDRSEPAVLAQLDRSQRTLTKLDAAQRTVTAGILADEERKDAIWKLWNSGMTQDAIARRLSEVSIANGGRKVTRNAVGKLISHMKARDE